MYIDLGLHNVITRSPINYLCSQIRTIVISHFAAVHKNFTSKKFTDRSPMRNLICHFTPPCTHAATSCVLDNFLKSKPGQGQINVAIMNRCKLQLLQATTPIRSHLNTNADASCIAMQCSRIPVCMVISMNASACQRKRVYCDVGGRWSHWGCGKDLGVLSTTGSGSLSIRIPTRLWYCVQ